MTEERNSFPELGISAEASHILHGGNLCSETTTEKEKKEAAVDYRCARSRKKYYYFPKVLLSLLSD